MPLPLDCTYPSIFPNQTSRNTRPHSFCYVARRNVLDFTLVVRNLQTSGTEMVGLTKLSVSATMLQLVQLLTRRTALCPFSARDSTRLWKRRVRNVFGKFNWREPLPVRGRPSTTPSTSILNLETDVRERRIIVCSVKMDPTRTVVPCSLRGYPYRLLVGVR